LSGGRVWFRGGVALAIVLAAALWGSRSGVRIGDSAMAVPDYAAEVARLDAAAASLRARADAAPGAWMPLEALAGAQAELARLTGDWAHYAAADSLYARAFAFAPAGAGPHLGRAALDFTLHRLDRVEPALVAAERQLLLDDPHRAAIAGLRGDVHLQRGRLVEARAAFEAALALHEGMQGRARLAQGLWKSGDIAGAEAQYRDALARFHGEPASPRAWIHLQLGLIDLEAGRLGDALAHYRDAERALRGWWLIDEHIAEIHALEGRHGEAIRRYEDLVRRTGNPEFMSALAEQYGSMGRAREAQALIAAAARAHEDRLAHFPEAAAGHALDFHLAHGRDPGFTLRLAEGNWRLRPNDEARSQLERALRNAETARAGAARGGEAGGG
jgi:tetratricopeptide (TPR) repeat protein